MGWRSCVLLLVLLVRPSSGKGKAAGQASEQLDQIHRLSAAFRRSRLTHLLLGSRKVRMKCRKLCTKFVIR